MTSSQPNKDKRVTVTLSLKRSVLRKLNRKARELSTDDKVSNRSKVAEEILEAAL